MSIVASAQGVVNKKNHPVRDRVVDYACPDHIFPVFSKKILPHLHIFS